MNYTLQSCDESSYPSISNLCWVGSHPYEGLFVSINQIFQGQPIDENKRYQLVLSAVGVCFENVPNLLVLEPQICDTSNGFLYRNCETGEEVVFFFALQDPIDNVLKIDGTCDCWELQGPGSPATVILYDNYSECDTCENCKTELCENGERTIGTAVVVELPDPPPPDRGFDKCCYNNLVLADLSDIDPYKNDFNGFFFKRQTPNSTVNFILIRLSDASEYNLNDATYGDFVDFGGNQPDLSYYVVDWRKVLSLLGVGGYQIKKELTIAGVTVDIFSNTFNLQEFSIDIADKTVRFDSYMNGKLINIDTDFSNSGYKTSLRVPGFFGRGDYSYEEDRISQRDYKFKQNTVNRSTEYQYQAELLPECITSELWDFLLFGDEIQISDYNKNNHSYKYDRISVKLEDNGGTEFSSLTRNANINLTFSNRIENNRKTNC